MTPIPSALTKCLWIWLWVLSSVAWSEPKFRVVVSGQAPFFLEMRQGHPRGLSPNLWERCRESLPLDCEYSYVADPEQALTLVRTGQADLAMGPISARSDQLEQLDFSFPYLESPLAVLVLRHNSNLFQRFSPSLRTGLVAGGLVFVLALTGVGLLVWLFERRSNPEHFPAAAHQGLEEAIWLAVTTATSVGYGDRFPVTRPGRLVMAVWMILAGITFSVVTALISTSLTLSHIPGMTVHTLHDLRSLHLAVVKDSPAGLALNPLNARITEVESLDRARQLLDRGKVQAVVSSGLILREALGRDARYQIQQLNQASLYFCFALPKDSPWTRRLNASLLRLQESGVLQEATDRWLNRGE